MDKQGADQAREHLYLKAAYPAGYIKLPSSRSSRLLKAAYPAGNPLANTSSTSRFMKAAYSEGNNVITHKQRVLYFESHLSGG